MRKCFYLVFALFFVLSACQEEDIENSSEKDIQENISFTFEYDGVEYIEYIDHLPSSPLDIPVPKNKVVYNAMQQPNAAVFANVKNKKAVIFDSVEEAKKALGVSSIEEELPINQRSSHSGQVTMYDKPNFDCSSQDCIVIGVGLSPRKYKDRLADLSNLYINDELVNLDRRISSIKIASLSPSKWLTVLFYEGKNYSGRALILQCPPDVARPPIDYNASLRYLSLPNPPPGDGFKVIQRSDIYHRPGSFARRAGCNRGFINTDYTAAWDNRIRSVETFFLDEKYSTGCVPF